VHHYSTGALIRRWIQRHQTIVWSATIGLVILAVIGGVSIDRIRSANQALESKNTELDRSNITLRTTRDDLEIQLTLSRHNEGKADLLRAEDYLDERNDFFAFLMAARALGLDTQTPRLRPASTEASRAHQLLAQRTRPRLVWQSHTPGLLHHPNVLHRLIFSPDHQHLIALDQQGQLSAWDVLEGTPRWTRSSPHRLRSMVFDGSGERLIAAGDDGHIYEYSTQTGELLQRWQAHSSALQTLALTPNGQHLIIGTSDWTLEVFTYPARTFVMSLEGHREAVTELAISVDGRTMVSGSERDRAMRTWTLRDERGQLNVVKGRRIYVRNYLKGLALSPTGERVASVDASGRLLLWEVASGTELLSTPARADAGYEGVVFDSTGQQLVTFGRGALNFFSAQALTPIRALNGHHAAVHHVAFSADGTWLASAGADRLIHMWSATTGQARCPTQGHVGDVNAVRFSPDGRHLISAGDGGQVGRVHKPGNRRGCG